MVVTMPGPGKPAETALLGDAEDEQLSEGILPGRGISETGGRGPDVKDIRGRVPCENAPDVKDPGGRETRGRFPKGKDPVRTVPGGNDFDGRVPCVKAFEGKDICIFSGDNGPGEEQDNLVLLNAIV
jgi:hypothetical protein